MIHAPGRWGSGMSCFLEEEESSSDAFLLTSSSLSFGCFDLNAASFSASDKDEFFDECFDFLLFKSSSSFGFSSTSSGNSGNANTSSVSSGLSSNPRGSVLGSYVPSSRAPRIKSWSTKYSHFWTMVSFHTYGWMPTLINEVGSMRASIVPGFHPAAVS